MAVPTSDNAASPTGIAAFAGRQAPTLTLTAPSASGTVGVIASGGVMRVTGALAPVPFALVSNQSATLNPASGTLPPNVDVPYTMTALVAGTHAISLSNGSGITNPAPVAFVAVEPPPPSPFKGAVDLIDAAPMNSWVRMNINSYQDAWSPSYTRPSGGGYGQFYGPDSPTALLGCWASVGVLRGVIVVFGGGHANSYSNETYTFSFATRQWKNAFLCTDYTTVQPYVYRPADGNSSPLSSHCYHNNVGLPILNRFYTGGGATAGTGDTQMLWDGNTRVRRLGGFTLDLTLAGQGYVAGETGSNVHWGANLNVDVPGANAWKYRDWCDGRNTALAAGGERIETGTVCTAENGHDVLYFPSNGYIYRVEIFDDNQLNDVVTRVSGPTNGMFGNGAMAMDEANRLLFFPTMQNTAVKVGLFVDLKRSIDFSRPWEVITSMVGQEQDGFMGPAGDDISKALSRVSGLTHDPRLGCFVIWTIGRQPFLIYPPAGNPTPTTGWTVVKPVMDTVTSCPRSDFAAGDTGTNGKFRYVPEIGCSVAVVGTSDGDVWALKLEGWQRPAGV